MKKDFDFDDIGKRTPYRTRVVFRQFFQHLQHRWILRGCATKGDGTRRSEATAEISHEADYFYGDYHGGSIDRIFVCSIFETGR